MFKGVDRTKYDLKDPSAWHAIKRDEALHKEALLLVARHLNQPPPKQSGARVPYILLPKEQRPRLDMYLSTSMATYEKELQTRTLPVDKKF